MLTIPTNDLLVLMALGLGSVLVGLWAGRGIRTAEQFLTAGRGAGRLLVAASLFGGSAAALALLAVVGGFGHHGLGGLRPLLAAWLWLPLLLWVWAPVLQRNRLITVPQYLGRRFDARVRRGAAVLTLFGLLGLAALELAAVGVTLQALTGQPAAKWVALLALGVTAYAAWGGLRAVLLVDLLLGAIVLGGLGLLTWLALDLAGPTELWAGAPRSLRSFAPEAATRGDLAALGALTTDVLPIALAGLLGSQALTGRLVSARGERAAGGGLLLWVGPLTLGLLAGLAAAGLAGLLLADLGHLPRAGFPEAGLAAVLGALGGPGTLGLLLGLVLAAAMTTLDGLLVGVAAVVVVDLAPGATPLGRAGPGRARLATLVAGAAALGLAFAAQRRGGLAAQGAILALVAGLPVGLVVLAGLVSRRLRGGTALAALLVVAATAAFLVAFAATPPGADGLARVALAATAAGLTTLGAGWLWDRRRAAPARPNLTWAELSPPWPTVTVVLPLSLTEEQAGADPAPPVGDDLPVVRLPEALRIAEGWAPGCEVVLTPRRGALLGLRALRAVVGPDAAAPGVVALSPGAALAADLTPDTPVRVERVS